MDFQDSPNAAKHPLDRNAWQSTLWCMIASFGTYFCMYGFRKPFAVGVYQAETWGGMDYKAWLVIAQVLGYTASKFCGIRVVSESQRDRRPWAIVALIGAAQVALLGFAVIPPPYGALCLFLNGLPLGMVFGLVLGYLEGRRVTEVLVAVLCASFILADGVSKSLGAYLLQWGCPEHWMPFAAGMMFLGPLGIFVSMLSQVGLPSDADVEARRARIPMDSLARSKFFARYAPGLVGLIGVYGLLTILRSLRADFQPEIWMGLGVEQKPSQFALTELWVGLSVTLVSGALALVADNRRAFLLSMASAGMGFVCLMLAMLGWWSGALSPFAFMVVQGIGLYIPYVVVHTTVFERLMAMTRDRGTMSYLMYLADAWGYLGYVAVVIMRQVLPQSDRFMAFYGAITWVVSGLGLACLAASTWYFHRKLSHSLAAAVVALLMLGQQAAAEPGPAADPPSPTRWWKGNLHTHSLWSDGDDFPEMIAAWYRAEGYHFLALSDHNILLEGEKWVSEGTVRRAGGVMALEKYRAKFGEAWVETRPSSQVTGEADIRLKNLAEFRSKVEEPGRFLLIPSEEITGEHAHINATNIVEMIAPVEAGSVRERIVSTMRAINAQAQRLNRSIVPHLNHPNLGNRGLQPEELASILEDRLFEVFNGVENDGDLGSETRHSLERLWDIASTLRMVHFQAPPLFGVAVDDSHDYHGHESRAQPGRGWVMVRASELRVEPILAALLAGDFYASSGVVIDDIVLKDNRYQIRIAPEADTTYETQFIGTLRHADVNGTPRTEDPSAPRDYPQVGVVLATAAGLNPEYRLTGQELYVRAVVTGSRPPRRPTSESPWQKAWTQPVGWESQVRLGTAR